MRCLLAGAGERGVDHGNGPPLGQRMERVSDPPPLPPLQWPDLQGGFSSRWEFLVGWLAFGLLVVAVPVALASHWVVVVLGAASFFALLWLASWLEKARLRRTLENVENQIARRGKIPREVWGTDPRRADVAAEILRRAHISWKHRHFMPDDPFVIIVAAHTYLDDEEISIEDLGRELLGRLLAREDVERIGCVTFDEVVNFFLTATRQGHRCLECRYDLTGNLSGRCPECGTVVAGKLAEPRAREHKTVDSGRLPPRPGETCPEQPHSQNCPGDRRASSW